MPGIPGPTGPAGPLSIGTTSSFASTPQAIGDGIPLSFPNSSTVIGNDIIPQFSGSSFYVQTTGTYLVMVNLTADAGFTYNLAVDNAGIPGATFISTGGSTPLTQVVSLVAGQHVTVQGTNALLAQVTSASITFVRLN